MICATTSQCRTKITKLSGNIHIPIRTNKFLLHLANWKNYAIRAETEMCSSIMIKALYLVRQNFFIHVTSYFKALTFYNFRHFLLTMDILAIRLVWFLENKNL